MFSHLGRGGGGGEGGRIHIIKYSRTSTAQDSERLRAAAYLNNENIVIFVNLLTQVTEERIICQTAVSTGTRGVGWGGGGWGRR